MKTKEHIDREAKFGANNYNPLDIIVTKGQGVYVWDIDDKQYIDCLAGYSALNQGHCHPKIVTTMKEQLDKLTLTSRAFRNDQLGSFYKKLCEITKFEKVLPMNTGAEAVETAIKLARKWGYERKGVQKDKAEIIVCENNFHGRTTTIVGFSSDEHSKDGFGPFGSGFVMAEFGNAKSIEAAITKNTVAVLIEPIQGEGGIIIPEDGYLKKLRNICTENNVLLMLDEIQTGLGRTGKMFAYEHEQIRPDVLILGKALSGGVYPVSVVLADDKYMSVFTPSSHGSTYGGNPIAAAVGITALEVLEQERLAENSAILGNYLLQELRKIESSVIKDVRGIGLLVGIELNNHAGGARKYCEELIKHGLLCKESHENVIRLTPPLIITKKQIDTLISTLKKVLLDEYNFMKKS